MIDIKILTTMHVGRGSQAICYEKTCKNQGCILLLRRQGAYASPRMEEVGVFPNIVIMNYYKIIDYGLVKMGRAFLLLSDFYLKYKKEWFVKPFGIIAKSEIPTNQLKK